MSPKISSVWFLFPLLLWVGFQAGCAMNLSEARPARVLKGGEIEVAEINNVVVPTRIIKDIIDPGKTAVKHAKSGEDLSEEEERDMVGAVAAIALSGPGFGAHTEIGFGLGYGFDTALRIGNGIYALSFRRGFELGEAWDAAIGVRAGYNSGASVVPYFEDINKFAKLTEMKRLDLQLFGQVGRQFGDWGRFWAGVKGMTSPFAASINASVSATDIDLGRDDIRGRIDYYAGFAGFAIGYRWIFFVVELTGAYTAGKVSIFGDKYDLSGPLIAPSWGFQGTF